MGVVPPGSVKGSRGFDFHEGGIWFTALTLEALAEKLQEYRAANGTPLGNPLQEVIDFNDRKTRLVQSQKAGPNLREQAIKWLESKLRTKPTYVDQEEADRRAAICVECPRNTMNWKPGSCQTCVKNADRAVAILLSGRKPHPLGVCATLAQVNTVSVYLNDPKVENIELPDFCWRRVK